MVASKDYNGLSIIKRIFILNLINKFNIFVTNSVLNMSLNLVGLAERYDWKNGFTVAKEQIK